MKIGVPGEFHEDRWPRTAEDSERCSLPGTRPLQGVVAAVLELLVEEAVGIFKGVVDDLSVLDDGDDVGVDEAAVWLEVELGIPIEDFLVELRVDVDGVGLDEVLAGFVVAFALDALDFGEKFGEEIAEGWVVVDDEVGLAVPGLLLDDVVLQAFLVAPLGDQLAVLHVGFGVLGSEFDSGELGEEAIADVA